MSDGSNKAGKWVCNGKPEHYKWPELLDDIATLNKVLGETLGLIGQITLNMPHREGFSLVEKVQDYISEQSTKYRNFEPRHKYTSVCDNVVDYFLTVARINGGVEQDVLPTWQPKSACRCTLL